MISPAHSHERPATVRIVLADDQPIVRAGLRQLIARNDHWRIIAEADSATAAVNACRGNGCDLLIIDPALPGGGSLELLRQVCQGPDAPQILAFSDLDERIWAERCLRAGAHGYLMKQSSEDQILRTIQAILRGERWLSITLMGALVDRAVGTHHGSGSVSTLSDRELEVFRCIGDGATTRVIADTLHVSVKTVEAHKANIKRKLGANDAGELARLAMEWAAA